MKTPKMSSNGFGLVRETLGRLRERNLDAPVDRRVKRWQLQFALVAATHQAICTLRESFWLFEGLNEQTDEILPRRVLIFARQGSA